MLGTATGFGKVGICVLQKRILVAVTDLIFETGVTSAALIFAFCRTFGSVRIVIGYLFHALCHAFSSQALVILHCARQGPSWCASVPGLAAPLVTWGNVG